MRKGRSVSGRRPNAFMCGVQLFLLVGAADQTPARHSSSDTPEIKASRRSIQLVFRNRFFRVEHQKVRMVSLLTCREFLQELAGLLDETAESDLRRKLEIHVRGCPNCFVILDSTRKTIRLFRGMLLQKVPDPIHVRLMKALERRMAARKP